MNKVRQFSSPGDRLDHLVRVISSERFLKMESLNNEVPFFIYPFEAADAVQERGMFEKMLKQLDEKGVSALTVNLYDLAIEILEKRGILKRLLEMESRLEKDQLKETLQGVLDPEAHLVPAIQDRTEGREFDVLLITGVGEVFPYIRSHNVLNNLQRVAKGYPTVMFFPGAYTHEMATGASLDLFGKLHDDKYYRAFNILHVEGT